MKVLEPQLEFLQSNTTCQGGQQVTFLQIHGEREREKRERLGTKCSLCGEFSVPGIHFHKHVRESLCKVWEVTSVSLCASDATRQPDRCNHTNTRTKKSQVNIS